jgi:acyl carrier protein
VNAEQAMSAEVEKKSMPRSARSRNPRAVSATDDSGNEQNEMIEDIRAILADHGRLSVAIAALTDDADLYQAGLTSHASVNVMLALEEKFDIEFPDRMLKRGVFESVTSIRSAIEELKSGG